MLQPDWSMAPSPVAKIETELGIKFQGPGLYIDADGDCLIIYSAHREYLSQPGDAGVFWAAEAGHGELFTVLVFNGRADEVRHEINALQHIPLRRGLAPTV